MRLGLPCRQAHAEARNAAPCGAVPATRTRWYSDCGRIPSFRTWANVRNMFPFTAHTRCTQIDPSICNLAVGITVRGCPVPGNSCPVSHATPPAGPKLFRGAPVGKSASPGSKSASRISAAGTDRSGKFRDRTPETIGAMPFKQRFHLLRQDFCRVYLHKCKIHFTFVSASGMNGHIRQPATDKTVTNRKL